MRSPPSGSCCGRSAQPASSEAVTTTVSSTVDTDPAPTDRNSQLAAQRRLVRRLVWVAAVVICLLGVRAGIAEPLIVHSDSMSPTLHDGDVIVVDKLTYHWRDPRRGEVVVVRVPESDALIIKRVVAVAGDSVGLDDGRLVVNGAAVAEPYANHTGMDGAYYGPITVADGHVFALGDNRHDSTDSRLLGQIATSSISGRMAVRVWSSG